MGHHLLIHNRFCIYSRGTCPTPYKVRLSLGKGVYCNIKFIVRVELDICSLVHCGFLLQTETGHTLRIASIEPTVSLTNSQRLMILYLCKRKTESGGADERRPTQRNDHHVVLLFRKDYMISSYISPERQFFV